MDFNIAILGGGNLGQAIAIGLLNNSFDPSRLTVTRNKIERLKELESKGINITSNNVEAVETADIIIVAVKPYNITEVLEEIKPALKSSHTLISVVSDYSIEKIYDIVPKDVSVYRAMPNTAIAVQNSVTCIAGDFNTKEFQYVDTIFSALGETVQIKEELMDAATVLGACGIAFILRFMRAMTQGGIEIGFDAVTASRIATQTVKGASELLIQNGNHPEAEIDKVTTPKGCTIAGLNEMEHQGFSAALIKGIKTSFESISK